MLLREYPGSRRGLRRCTLVIVLKRRSIAIVALALFAGLAPLSAAVLFCTEAPCCIGEPERHASMSRPHPDCCAPVSCYEPPAQKLPNESALQTFSPVSTLSAGFVPQAPRLASHTQSFESDSPPQTHARRLSVLSTLLI